MVEVGPSRVEIKVLAHSMPERHVLGQPRERLGDDGVHDAVVDFHLHYHVCRV